MRIELLVLPVCLLAAACLRPSESRAERDRRVGQAQAHGLEVRVRDGLAAVRSLDSGALSLWAGAPSLEVTLRRDAGAAHTWELEVKNCLPDAQLVVGD